jgi:plasmid stabilization system protein ParE
MTPSVSPEADRELTESALFYVREANAEVGLALILEYERALALLCGHPHLGAPWRKADAASRCGNSLTVSSTMFVAKS